MQLYHRTNPSLKLTFLFKITTTNTKIRVASSYYIRSNFSTYTYNNNNNHVDIAIRTNILWKYIHNNNNYMIRPVSTTTTTTRNSTNPSSTSTAIDNTYNSSNSHNNNNTVFDYLVIGAGSGGIASARRAAAYGANVAVIEKSRLGGTCVNVGCVPKKIMWNAASIAEVLHEMHHYGFSSSSSTNTNTSHSNKSINDLAFDWKFLKEARDKYITKLNGIYERNMANSGVTHVKGLARFVNVIGEPNKRKGVLVVEVVQENGQINQYNAKNILIAVGGKPEEFPEVDGIREHSITSDGFFELEALPKKAVVVGAGYIAVELAGVLNSLGTSTSLVVRKAKALRDFDESIADTLDEAMIRQGITIYRNTNGVKSISLDTDNNLKKTVLLNNGEIIHDVDCVLMATGREPVVKPLQLENAGIVQGPKGHIIVDEYSQTNAEGIFALGDVCGNVELTPMAIAAGRRLADRLFGPEEFKDAKVSYENVATVVFSHPPIGTIGLTEAQAVTKYGEDHIKIYKSKFVNLYYGPWMVDFETKPKTLMKLICAGKEELVVGCHVIGMGADEMLQGFGIALKMGATKADFDSCVAIHPSAAEEFVTMFPWGVSAPVTGAKVSPLNGATSPEPTGL